MEPIKKPAFKPALAYQHGSLKTCLARIDEQRQCLEMIKKALPADIAIHTMHCLVSGNQLLIYADSAGWASQIRYFQQAILNKMRESGQRNIRGIKVKLMASNPATPIKRRARRPSSDTICSILSSVDTENHDELSKAMLKLGNTLRNKLPDAARQTDDD